VKTDRDLELARLLASTQAPPLKPAFTERLWARIDAQREEVVAPARRPVLRRPRVAVTLFAAAAAATVIAATLMGWPLTRQPTGGGPPPAVAQVLKNVESTLAATRSMRAVFFYDRAQVRVPAGTGEDLSLAQLVERAAARPLQRRLAARVLATADGRMRSLSVKEPGGSWGLPRAGATVTDTPGLHVQVRNQPGGYAYEVWRNANGLQVRRVVDPPPGPPDATTSGWFPGEYGGLLSPVALSEGTVSASTYEGRAVVVVTTAALPSSVSVDREGRFTSPVYDRVSMIVDRKTWLPLRVERSLHGRTVEAWGFSDLRLDVPVSMADFELTLPETATFYDRDAGFRRLSLRAAARAVHGRLFIPTRLPAGFTLALATAKTGSLASPGDSLPGVEATLEGPWRSPESDIASLVYRKGFRRVTITCRRVKDATSALSVDPFSATPGNAARGRSAAVGTVRLNDGALRGALARIRTDALELPHLWALHDGLLVTVAGDLSRDELVAVANSLETYGTWRTGKVFDAYLDASRRDDSARLDALLVDGVVLRLHRDLLAVKQKRQVIALNGDVLDPLLTGTTVSLLTGDGFALWESWNRGDSIPLAPGIDGGSASVLLVRLGGDRIAGIDYFLTTYWATTDLGEGWHPSALQPSHDPRDTEAAAAKVARAYEAALADKDVGRLARLTAPGVEFLDIEHGVRGDRATLRARYMRMFDRPRDLEFTDVRRFVGPGWAAVMWTASSRARATEATGLTVLEIRNGRIARETIYACKAKMPFE
jgi:hypothetical protein